MSKGQIAALNESALDLVCCARRVGDPARDLVIETVRSVEVVREAVELARRCQRRLGVIGSTPPLEARAAPELVPSRADTEAELLELAGLVAQAAVAAARLARSDAPAPAAYLARTHGHPRGLRSARRELRDALRATAVGGQTYLAICGSDRRASFGRPGS